MYLDRPIREAELLQTIARVNRTGYDKKFGIVVDYFGLAHHLKQALNVYADEDIGGALQSLDDEIPVLRDRHLRVVDLFRSRGIENLTDIEACAEVLADERLRAEFSVKLKQFLNTLDVVLPRPEGLAFSPDAKLLAFIYARAPRRCRFWWTTFAPAMWRRTRDCRSCRSTTARSFGWWSMQRSATPPSATPSARSWWT
jgi:type I restriction enzyme R subunit